MNNLTTLAIRFADADNTLGNATKRLTEHAEWSPLVASFDKSIRGHANILARAVLGLPDDEPIKVGPKGKQRVTVNGRRIESLARLISKHADKGPKPMRLAVNLSGDDVTGGTVVIDADHEMFGALMALFAAAEADAA